MQRLNRRQNHEFDAIQKIANDGSLTSFTLNPQSPADTTLSVIAMLTEMAVAGVARLETTDPERAAAIRPVFLKALVECYQAVGDKGATIDTIKIDYGGIQSSARALAEGKKLITPMDIRGWRPKGDDYPHGR